MKALSHFWVLLVLICLSVLTERRVLAGADNGPYTTFDKDRVIQAVRLVTSVQPLLLDPLLPNTVLPVAEETNLDSLLHHNFINAYMNPLAPASRIAILDNVIFALSNLQPPEGDMGEGVITATLIWNATSMMDVSLFVLEPNGAEVTDENFMGPSGSIEAAPEYAQPSNYSVACANLEPGSYRLGGFIAALHDDNAFADSAISIRAGSLEEQVNFRLFPEPDAQSIFEQVVLAADVVVTDIRGQGKLLDFRFDIRALPLPAPPLPPLHSLRAVSFLKTPHQII